ncbi:heavy-metal-associated domain-containing protein [Nakamurella sp. GG22]
MANNGTVRADPRLRCAGWPLPTNQPGALSIRGGAVMMFNTPRVFVGTTTILIAGMNSATDLQTVGEAINQFPGIRLITADEVAGVITVTAERPVDRTDLTAAIVQAGYTVLE